MLEVARTIRYIHSVKDVAVLSSGVIDPRFITLDSDLRAKVMFSGYFTWQKSVFGLDNLAAFTSESNIAAFGFLFQKVCFRGDDPKHLVEDVRRLIEGCCAKGPKSRPSIETVVKEMETWDLT
ncbi:hypothetical protein M378DRAFT_1013927 [Amanita muscaria Koide BX008]|uniref:Uncharacterized protein n=1 Tax=Amanita muscaria (strain Koide BX008) TaxID=946122 RepID=A0A0C2WSC4_AMAMK|nr:hypothetical protein M378DRAFT_1013927 [Amanita muscaria Koide BX008]